MRPVVLSPDAQMLRPRDPFFGYLSHSEAVEVVFPLAKGERSRLPSVADSLNASPDNYSGAKPMAFTAAPAGIAVPDIDE